MKVLMRIDAVRWAWLSFVVGQNQSFRFCVLAKSCSFILERIRLYCETTYWWVERFAGKL